MIRVTRMAFLTLVAIVLTACGAGAEGDADGVHIVVDAQQIGPSKTIVVREVFADATGWLVLHRANQVEGVGNETISRTPVAKGASVNVAINIVDDIAQDEPLYVVLHADLGKIGIYEPGKDVPVESGNGNGVQASNVVAKLNVNLSSFIAEAPVVGLKSMLIIREFASPKNGWLVARSNSGSAVLGKTLVDAKLNVVSPVYVSLNRDLIDNETVSVVVVDDANSDNNFDDADIALLDSASAVAVKSVTVAEIAAYPDIMLSVSSTSDYSGYVWTNVAPLNGKYASPVGEGSKNQTLSFVKGLRYQILRPELFGSDLSKAGVNVHPLEIISADANPLLSETGAGTLENDATTAWSFGNGVITFTVSDALATNLARYRCAYHSLMTGNIVIVTP